MNNTEYVIATPADQADLIDFANYVFSQAHEPHDFKQLLPKAYGDQVTEGARHYLAKQNDRIRALVGCLPLDIHVLDRTLRAGMVGTVSVHLYARGEGHMKHLMKQMIDDSRARGFDLLILGGQRQRYNHFGFDRAGTALSYTVTSANLHHCLRDVDVSNITFSELTEEHPDEVDFACRLVQSYKVHGERPRADFLPIMHSWHCRCRLIRRNGEMIGYVTGSLRIGEIGLTDESLLPAVLKALFAADNLTHAEITVAPFEKERIRALSTLSEECSVHSVEMINVLNWQPVLEAMLALKADCAPMADGCVTLNIDGEVLTLRVENGRPSVCRDDRAPDLTLSHLEAIRLLFGMESAVCAHPLPLGWLPLPFYLSSPDCF